MSIKSVQTEKFEALKEQKLHTAQCSVLVFHLAQSSVAQRPRHLNSKCTHADLRPDGSAGLKRGVWSGALLEHCFPVAPKTVCTVDQ